MIGIILAAGRGKRVSKAIKNKPKWSIKYRNKKLIDYQIQLLKEIKLIKFILLEVINHLYCQRSIRSLKIKNGIKQIVFIL